MTEQVYKATGQSRLYVAKDRQKRRLHCSNPVHSFQLSTMSYMIQFSFIRQLKLISSSSIPFIRINRLCAAGLLDYWRYQYWPRPNRCSEPLTIKINHSKGSSSNTNNRLTLSYVYWALFALGVRSIVAYSLIAFDIELFLTHECIFIFSGIK